MSKIYDSYDDIAYFYNKYWTARPQELMMKAVALLLFPTIKKDSHILDLCCGTGNVAAFLCKKGYNVTGVDGSEAMLNYARKNAPKGEFILGDAREFKLNHKFDAALCLFDSINHILYEGDLVNVFTHVFDSLKKKGVCIFDANTMQSSAEASDMDFFAVNSDEVFMIKCDYDKESELTSYRSTFFIHEEGSWRRGDSLVQEKYHSPKTLINALKEAGFSNIAFADGASLGIKDFKDRLFFSAEKE